MNENIKRNVVQARLNDAELEQFVAVKSMLNAESNSEAFRKMIADEKLAAEQNSGKRLSWSQLKQSPMSQANVDNKQLNKIVETYTDIQAHLESLDFAASNLTNNMNQVAKATNQAKQVDPANIRTWKWVIDALNKMFPAVQQLQGFVNQAKVAVKKGA